MTFKYRFAYYMFGFLIGIFFVGMIYSGKDTRCNYFPNARVLNDLRTKPFHYSDEASAILAQKWVETIDVKNTLQYGDVDFDKSNKVFKGGKLYTIEGKTTQNQPILLEVINYSDKAVLVNIKKI